MSTIHCDLVVVLVFLLGCGKTPSTGPPTKEEVKAATKKFFENPKLPVIYQDVEVVSVYGPMEPSARIKELFREPLLGYYATFTAYNVPAGKKTTEKNVLVWVVRRDGEVAVVNNSSGPDEGKDWYTKNPPPAGK